MDNYRKDVKFSSLKKSEICQSKYSEKYKKQGPLRQNSAQSRLERIRSNFTMKRKINNKLEKFNHEEPVSHCNVSQKTSILVQKFMPDSSLFAVDKKDALEGKLKRYAADKRLEKGRAAVRNRSAELSLENASANLVGSSSHSVLKRLSRDKTAEQNVWAGVAPNERHNELNCSAGFDDEITASAGSSGSGHLVTRSSMSGSTRMSTSKPGQKTEKLVSRKRNSADGRLQKARAIERRNIDTSPKELFSSTPRISSNSSMIKRTVTYEDDAPKEPTNTCQAGRNNARRLKKITVINSRETVPKKLSFEFKNPSYRSVMKRTSKLITNGESWVDKTAEVLDNSRSFGTWKGESEVDDMSMDVDMEILKTDELVTSKSLNPERSSTLTRPREFTDCEGKSSRVSFVNDEIHKLRLEPGYIALHENFMFDVEMNLALPSGDILIVIDTNIFFSYLSFIQRLLKCQISSYQSPTLVVLWPVIQEIDYAIKKNNDRLSAIAKSANLFIFDCLKNKHPRVFGQSLADFKDNFKNAVSVDDYILQYCLKLVAARNNVILLTDDKNLSSKCMVNHVPVLTKIEFESAFGLAQT